jgi:hypothetical protein
LSIKVIIEALQKIIRNFLARMFAGAMLYQLVLSIVFDIAQFASIRLVISMPTFMIFAISNSGKSFIAIIALIRFFPSVRPHVNKEITLFGKNFTASILGTFKKIMTAVGTFHV